MANVKELTDLISGGIKKKEEELIKKLMSLQNVHTKKKKDEWRPIFYSCL